MSHPDIEAIAGSIGSAQQRTGKQRALDAATPKHEKASARVI
ncbi:hypothetical protein [Sorangium sp. So ce513]